MFFTLINYIISAELRRLHKFNKYNQLLVHQTLTTTNNKNKKKEKRKEYNINFVFQTCIKVFEQLKVKR